MLSSLKMTVRNILYQELRTINFTLAVHPEARRILREAQDKLRQVRKICYP